MKRILLTGALGQLGSELTLYLRERYGAENVVATDIRPPKTAPGVSRPPKTAPGVSRPPAAGGGGEAGEAGTGPCYRLDCRDGGALAEIVGRHRIDTIFHLAALLSASGEAVPQKAWEVNIGGLLAVLEVAREKRCAVFTPSSIAAFGPNTPRDFTPQDTIQRPTSIYGISKVTGELLCDYYHHKYGVDTRGVRYPGIISHLTPPGGGTTDYAVEIFHAAIREGRYTCFLAGDTYLEMIYMPDALRAAVDLMEADPARLRHRNAFNLSAMSFCPEDLAAYIRRYLPHFEIRYQVDPVRQALADSWPNSLEDYAARVEWGWSPRYDLEAMTRDMLSVLSSRHTPGGEAGRLASGWPAPGGAGGKDNKG